ncbi:MAG: nitrous oxide-stimulated promoter family protein [Firmicutes bacterium]|nr:nitrous oxide-stimulated promoter family protein [Bacillota bacterium]MCM1400546.1 nitrous oxide-stimulated promoter family protein [Bacteroides sp.]MCM1476450.1 nitrous oxide-stimulated promoter family protein [Bacteroides sp.]
MTRIEAEKRVVQQMIEIYCRKHEGNCHLCPDCTALLHYALERLDKCPFSSDKTTCRKCRIHCYAPQMKARIKMVMRFSGPRMFMSHPLSAIRHLLQ